MRSKPARQLNVYESLDGYRWRLFSAGRIVAESGESYTRELDAVKAAKRLFSDYPVDLNYWKAGAWITERIR